MLLTFFMNQASALNVITFMAFCLLQVGSQSILGQNTPGQYLWETLIATGGTSSVLFIIWHLTFKRTQKQFEFSLTQNQEQFETALKQVNQQHKESLEQYKESLELNQKTTDRMLEIMKMEMEHKQLLAGILSEIKTSMKYHMEIHKG